ncbi:PEGA domain-containing protein [Candidatus Saccharibacteria bacterium]|nr:PEGA domain-containing protein [Candidatus Saccharibacteria bacterium]
MDRERKKRLHTWKIILTDAIIVILVASLAVVLSFIAMGYKFDDDGKLDQSGLLQAESTPTGATVIIDGEAMFLHTNMNHLLPEGDHEVRLEREGYDSWQNTVAIKSGKLYKLDYPRLFKQDREVKTIKNFGDKALDFFLTSPDRKNALYRETDSSNWSIIKIDKDDPEITEFDMSAVPGEFVGLVWSDDGDKVLTKWNKDGIIEYWLIDLAKPDNPLEINKEFGLEFSKMRFINGSELLGLESGNLRKVSISDRAVSRVLIDQVADFYNDNQEIVYVLDKDDSSDKRTVGLYRSDAKTEVIKKTTADNVLVAVSEYLGEQYVGVSSGSKIEIFHEKETVAKVKLDFVPEEASARIGRLMTFSAKSSDGGTNLAVFDAERGEIFNFKLESQDFFWLDDYLIGNVAEDKLYARDFDGTNRRELSSSAASNFDAVISKNNRWLYYLASNDAGELELKREEL